MDKTNKEEALESFNSLANSFFNSHLLLVQQNISLLLKAIAYYDYLLGVIKECNEGTHFESELRQNLTERGVILPSSMRRIIAFITNLLYKMDKEQCATDIILRQFPSADKNESYKRFLNEIMLPYIDAVNEYFNLSDLSEVPPLEETQEEPYSERIGEKLSITLKQIRDEIQSAKLNENERADLFFVIDSFLYLLVFRDTALIRLGYYTLRKSLTEKKMCEEKLLEIKNFLSEYNVI